LVCRYRLARHRSLFRRHIGNRPALAVGIDGLSDDFLAESFNQPPGMAPATKTRFEMIMSMKEHEMHHRAQLMLMQRMIGIVPHLTRQAQERMARFQAQQAQPAR